MSKTFSICFFFARRTTTKSTKNLHHHHLRFFLSPFSLHIRLFPENFSPAFSSSFFETQMNVNSYDEHMVLRLLKVSCRIRDEQNLWSSLWRSNLIWRWCTRAVGKKEKVMNCQTKFRANPQKPVTFKSISQRSRNKFSISLMRMNEKQSKECPSVRRVCICCANSSILRKWRATKKNQEIQWT
jgi:hypothetical protein